MSIARKIASKLLPHHKNHKLMSPPGAIPSGAGVPILVRSKMRSGTHLLIDLLLNNFPQLRTNSLYVELDHAFHVGIEAKQFEGLGQCLCKTHYAGLENQQLRKEIVEMVADQAIILETYREPTAIENSLKRFITNPESLEIAINEARGFDSYWAKYDGHMIDFTDLVSPEGNKRVIADVAKITGLKPVKKHVYNRPKSDAKLVLRDKLLTRLFGGRMKRVNTTIHFGG